MTTSVLIVHWDDLLNLSTGIDLSPSLLVQAARKQARLRHGAEVTLLVGSRPPPAGPEGALQRLGCRLHADAELKEDLAGALPAGAESDRRAVLVMGPDRAAEWQAALAVI